MSSTIARSAVAAIITSPFDLHNQTRNTQSNNETRLRLPNSHEIIHRTRMNSSNNNELGQAWSAQDKKITINIRGTTYETFESTLAKYPDTLLGCSQKRDEYYDQETRQFCFNRDRQAFNAILFYYQSSGKLIRPNDVKEETFLDDLKFFEIDPWNVTDLEYGPHNFKKPEKSNKVDGLKIGERGRLRMETSWRASMGNTNKQYPVCNVILSWPCAVCVVVYLFTTCLSSMPEYQSAVSTSCKNENTTRLIISHDNPIVLVRFLCSIWFVLEVILRFGLSLFKFQYFFSFVGAIDIISATSTFVQLLLRPTDTCPQSDVLMRLSNILRLSSFVCIFKLSRFSAGLRLFGQTLKACFGQFILSVYCIGMCVLFYSAIIYYSESEQNENIQSIFDAFWYTIITLTTVGYGDVVPMTIAGRLFGAMCSIFGATIIMAWPATIFVSYFTEIYNHEINKKMERSLWSRTKNKFRILLNLELSQR